MPFLLPWIITGAASLTTAMFVSNSRAKRRQRVTERQDHHGEQARLTQLLLCKQTELAELEMSIQPLKVAKQERLEEIAAEKAEMESIKAALAALNPVGQPANTTQTDLILSLV